MAVTADPDQSGIDTVLTVVEQQLHFEYSSRVREVAKSWADGLKGLLALSGLVGIAGAPLASSTLTDTTKVIVGSLLAAIFVTSTCGLLLVQSAASGTTKSYQMPGSMTGLLALQRGIADRAVTYLRLGRALACLAMLLFGVAATFAWTDSGKSDKPSVLVTTTKGVTYCGTIRYGADSAITVQIATATRKVIRIQDIHRIAPAPAGCT